MLLGFKVEIYIIKKLKKHIIPLLKLLERINFRSNFFVKKNKTSWCRCLLSGFKGENSLFNFLNIENKFSKQGYQINEMKKYGEISGLLLWELIIKKPIKKPSKYAPLSPSIKTLKMLSNKSSKSINIIRLIDWSEIIKLSIKFNLVNIKRIIIVDEINSPFKPSIKLQPLIKINKQNAEKKIAKYLLFKIISNNSNLDESTFTSKIATNNKINKHWIKNLFLAETKIFLSEKKPTKYIVTMKNLIRRSFKKKTIGISIKSPPAKGMFFLLEKDWWASPE